MPIILPEPFATALRAPEPQRVADAPANTPEALYARGLARFQIGRSAGALADFEAARVALGGYCEVEIGFLEIQDRSAIERAVARANAVIASKQAKADPWLDGRALHLLGLGLAKLRKSPEALVALLAAAQRFEQAADRALQAQVMDTLGSVYAALGKLEVSLGYYAVSLVAKTIQGDRVGMAITLGNIGRLHLRAGRHRDALYCFERDLELALALGDRRGEARMLNDIARAKLALEEPAQAIKCLEKQLAIARELRYRDLEVFALKDLALAHLATGKPALCRKRLDEAAKIRDISSDQYLKSILRAAHAEWLAARGDERAIPELHKVIQRFEKQELPDYEIPLRIVLARTLHKAGMLLDADDQLGLAERKARSGSFWRYADDIRKARGELGVVPPLVLERGRAWANDKKLEDDDGYLVLGELGSGAFGTVYRCHDARHDRVVAVKRLRLAKALEHGKREVLVESLRREFEAASRIRHPFIVRLYAIGLDQHDQPYLVSEFIEGMDLRKKMHAEQNRDPRAVLWFLEQLAIGVDVLHGNDVVHRDLKPANVLVRAEDGRPVIVDFGIAETKAMPPASGGTEEYAAPELYAGAAALPASDVYALGVILYEWLCGQRPLQKLSLSDKQWRSKVRTSIPTPLDALCKSLPRGVSALVDRMLAKQAESRPSAKVVAEECRRIAGDEPVVRDSGGRVEGKRAGPVHGGGEETETHWAPHDIDRRPPTTDPRPPSTGKR